MLYGRLDDLRERASDRLAQVLRQTGGTHQARTEREAFSVMYRSSSPSSTPPRTGCASAGSTSTTASAATSGGSASTTTPTTTSSCCIDWRAEAARPFYLATAASPGDVRRRRHIKTRGRTVVGLDDEVLDLAAADPAKHEGLTGEAALLAALNASRTGRMRDIVETIQAEQDRIIRVRRRPGVLVVQGGPGTGKTAVALHRAAYLLYTHREPAREARRAGRRPERDVPALHRPGAALARRDQRAAVHRRRPVSRASAPAAHRAAARRPRSRAGWPWPSVIAAAVRDRQRVPGAPVEVVIDGETLRAQPGAPAAGPGSGPGARAGRTTRRGRFRPRDHRRRSPRQLAARIGADVLGGGQPARPGRRRRHAAGAARRPRRAGRSSSELWPLLTPQRLLADLFASPERLAGRGAAAAPRPSARPAAAAAGQRRGPRPTCRCSTRPPSCSARTTGRPRAAAERARRRARSPTRRACSTSSARDLTDDDPEILMGSDLLDAGRLATRHEEDDDLTAAERAAADRTWAFGHVDRGRGAGAVADGVADADAALPGRSMTIVGDVAQTGDLAGRLVLGDVLEPLPGRPVAAGGADHQLPHARRDHGGRRRRAGGHRPGPGAAALGAGDRRRAVAAGQAAAGRPGAPAWPTPRSGPRQRLGDGRLAVIVPAARLRRAGRGGRGPCARRGRRGATRTWSGPSWCSPSRRPRGWSSTRC